MTAAAGDPDVEAARAQAAEILDERRFTGTDLPQPLREPFETLGGWLDDLFGWFVDLVPGGAPVGWAILAALVLLVAAALATRSVRRRTVLEEEATIAERRAGEDPRALEAEADRAEAAGDLARAIRLRFRAGLLDLDAAGVIELRPGQTTGAIAAQVGDERFDALRETFDAVAYGHAEPTAADAAAAREGWAALRKDRRRRREGVAA